MKHPSRFFPTRCLGKYSSLSSSFLFEWESFLRRARFWKEFSMAPRRLGFRGRRSLSTTGCNPGCRCRDTHLFLKNALCSL